ncbi:MAG TPA: formimidoylglutamase, partial [Cytophagales bacterium]|nr:formimidoylglutamase [Cytophagales bacterium]
MNLSLFFDPVSESEVNKTSDFSTFQNAFYINTGADLDWKNCDIALIGINDYRSNPQAEVNDWVAPDVIRNQLYKLNKSSVSYNLCDMGNLRNGKDPQDTEERLREVCEALMENNVIPLIIGGTHDFSVGQYHAYQKLDKLTTVLNVDACIDMKATDNAPAHVAFLNRILLFEPNYLFNFILLGYQSYVTDPELLNVFEKLHFEHYRLGAIREYFEDVEPIVRQSNMVSFDLGAIKIQDAPAQDHNRPFGLTGEEACRIAWYAGLSEKVNSFAIYEYYPQFDHKEQTANLIATMIWYFIEGYYHRIQYESYDSESFMKYNVSVNGIETLVFYKHKYTEKWWLEVPKPHLSIKSPDQFVVVPCSYNDYLM